jgi:hypothetical protein
LKLTAHVELIIINLSDRGLLLKMSDYRVLSAGDTAIVVEFGEQIDRKVSTTVLAHGRSAD